MSAVVKTFQTLKAIKLTKPMLAISEWHSNLMGYRKQGLFYDDLIPDESELVQTALSRLSPQQTAERLYRHRRALNLSLKKISLPEEEWITPQQDVRYLGPILAQVEGESLTRLNYDNLTSVPPALLKRNRST